MKKKGSKSGVSNVYPAYPTVEDIYNKGQFEENIDPEDVLRTKTAVNVQEAEDPIELDFSKDNSGDNLDIPGSDLDDNEESIGSEDEQNNFYSLGGDNHDD